VLWPSIGPADPWKETPLRVHFHHNKPFKKVGGGGAGGAAAVEGAAGVHVRRPRLPPAPVSCCAARAAQRAASSTASAHRPPAPHDQISKVVREIEVSHWGNIYVEEKYEVVSRAARRQRLGSEGLRLGGPQARRASGASTAPRLLPRRLGRRSEARPAAGAWLPLRAGAPPPPSSRTRSSLRPPPPRAARQVNAGTAHKGPFSRLRLAMQNVAKANSFQVRAPAAAASGAGGIWTLLHLSPTRRLRRLSALHRLNSPDLSPPPQELYSHLPPSAHSLYYRDLIGNISTSGVRKSAKEVRPRAGAAPAAAPGAAARPRGRADAWFAPRWEARTVPYPPPLLRPP
jgi:hypothetical protein